MNPEERFDLLAGAAWERLRDRRSYEWKIYLGVWAALGSAAGFAFSYDGTRTWLDLAVVLALTLVVLAALFFLWLPWIQEANERDQRTSYYWYSAMERTALDHLPDSLRSSAGEWQRYGERQVEWKWRVSRAAWGQVMITLAFASLLLYAVGGRQATHPRVISVGSIEAERFVLRDSQGRTRGVLEAPEEGAQLSLFDANGTRRARLAAYRDFGTSLQLADEHGEPKAGLGIGVDKAAVLTLDWDMSSGIALGMQGPSPRLTMSAQDHDEAVDLSVDEIGPQLKLQNNGIHVLDVDCLSCFDLRVRDAEPTLRVVTSKGENLYPTKTQGK